MNRRLIPGPAPCLGLLAFLATAVVAAEPPTAPPPKDRSRGYDDTPFLPGSRWRIHDVARPLPAEIDPGTASTQDLPGRPPADAVVLFAGGDTEAWTMAGPPEAPAKPVAWTVAGGVLEVVPKTGNIVTKAGFGSCQLHLEWQVPTEAQGKGQRRANSGVYLMSRYEVQILDPYANPTYADGAAGSIYGQHPPLVLPGRSPGMWQTYDIIFHAPCFAADRSVSAPATITVFFNGVLVMDHQDLLGRMAHAKLPAYEPHAAREPLMLQDHGEAVRFRNIWIRELAEPEAR